MKAVSCERGTLSVVDLPTPQPAKGQLRLDVRRCGICGSDLHAKDHADELTDVMDRIGYPDFMRRGHAWFFGHEFCGEVADRGMGVGKEFKPGTPVVFFPLVRVFAYTPLEFRDTLYMLAEGELDASPLITGTVGLETSRTPSTR